MRIILFYILLCVIFNISAQDKFKVEKASFSTSHAEFSPTSYQNGLVYCSDKKDDLLFTYVDQNGKHMTNLFFIEKSNGNWGNPKRLFNELKTHFHEGPTDFNSDETLIAVTLNNNFETKRKKNKSNKHSLGIYFANYKDGHWSEYYPFPYNLDSVNTAHPLFYNDTTLIFASDRAGGFGESDLYVSYFSNNAWTEPKNLGENINSEGAEKFPTKDKLGGLYFSSDRIGANKLDVYYAYKKINDWSVAANYSEINTPEDDFGLTYDETMNAGVFTTSKNMNDDIYSFKIVFPKFEDCNPIEPNDYCFTFTEEGALNVDTLPLVYEWNFGDGHKKRGIKARHCFEKHGDYTVELNVIDTITDEVFFNEASYDFYIEEIDYPFIESLDTVLLNAKVNLSGETSHVVSFDIRNYYWEIEEETFKTSSLDYVFSDTGLFNMQLAVTGPLNENGDYDHKCIYKSIFVTDDIKTAHKQHEKDNSLFTDTTDISVLEYNQVPPSKMSNVTYGVEIIKSDNKMDLNDPFFDKIKATHSIREYINDSIKEYSYVIDEDTSEVEIIKSNTRMALNDPYFDKYKSTHVIRELVDSSKTEYIYVVGEETSLAAVFPIFKETKEQGYDEAIVTSFENTDEHYDSIVNKNSLAVNNIQEGNELVIDKHNDKAINEEVVNIKTNDLDQYKIDLVLFDHDSYYLKPVMANKLKPIIELMTINKNIGIKIEAHTDNVGSESYNLNLSRKRGLSVKKYLLDNNLDNNRIEMLFFGESRPREDNNTVYGRSRNRRVEIKLYKYEK